MRDTHTEGEKIKEERAIYGERKWELPPNKEKQKET